MSTGSLPSSPIVSSKVVQVVNTLNVVSSTGATTIPFDDTIPQITEGNLILTRAITPINVANLLKIEVVVSISNSTAPTNLCVALFQDATANALACVQAVVPTAGYTMCIPLNFFMVAGTTSSTTFTVRAACESGTITINGSGGTRKYGGVQVCSITITEFLP